MCLMTERSLVRVMYEKKINSIIEIGYNGIWGKRYVIDEWKNKACFLLREFTMIRTPFTKISLHENPRLPLLP